MPRALLTLALLLPLTMSRLSAQESAAGGQAANQPSGLLTPPPDNAAPATSSSVSTKSSTSTTTTTTTKTKAAANSTSPQDIARIQQQEIIRRQELTFRANQALADARKAELGTNYPEARKNYLFACEAFGSISRSTASYANSAEGLTRVDLKLYQDSLNIGDAKRAQLLIEEVVHYNPNNKEANEKLVAINRMLANPNDTSLLGNPAVNPAFVKNVNEVQQLFAEAEQFRRTGQWDQAEERLKHILGIDPYNIAATQQLERIDAEKNAYADKARLETRTERLREVEEKWFEPILNKDATVNPQESQPSITRSSNFDLDEKLKSIFVSIHFDNATIEDATNSLSVESKRLDTQDHKGVNFIIQPEASTSSNPISLTLNNVPLGEALRYVCQLANVKYKVQDYAISIVPFNANIQDLISRTFIVQPDFVAPPSTSATGTGDISTGIGGARPLPPVTPAAGTTPADDLGGDTIRQALEAKGVKFPPGASAVYAPDTGQLKVLDTADQMELIEELVNAGQAPTLMVKIASKFVEINQDDLNDLTINSAFNFWNPLDPVTGTFAAVGGGPITNNPLTVSHFNTALPGSRAFGADGIDQLISPQNNQFNSIYLRGFLEGAQYNVVADALSQKKSYDLLSEPFVEAKSGEAAEVKAVRSFPYPTAFTEPELITPVTNNSNGLNIVAPPAVIATTPTEFNRKDVGVYLGITPQVGADNRTINLSLRPIVTDFQGFINYGSPISVANPDGTSSLLSNNDINQPVFNTRRINTKVLIRDGSTIVLGGLIREDMQTVDDKVPFLGDLPLVGRMFQSKAMKNTKRNLIIFVTANIYRNDGELLNPPEPVNAEAVLTSHASLAAPLPAQ